MTATDGTPEHHETDRAEGASGTEAANDAEPAYRSVLVFDGECPFCSAAASALRRLEGAAAIPWGDDRAQAFLDAQFGETPFAVVFADAADGRVWVGREAARELCERAGVPTLVGDVVGDNYEAIADAVRSATGADDEADDYHGTFPMTDAARERFDALASGARTTHRPGAEAGGRRER